MTERKSRLFSELQAKEILTRAAELDAGSAVRFTAMELRRIAIDATIAPSAIDVALSEAANPNGPPFRSGSGRWRTLARGLGWLGLGAGLGALAVAADRMLFDAASAAAVFGPSAAVTLYRALWHRWHGSLPDFLREIVLVLGAFTLTATAVEGFHATAPTLLWSLICGAAGSAVAVVELRARRPAAFNVAGR